MKRNLTMLRQPYKRQNSEPGRKLDETVFCWDSIPKPGPDLDDLADAVGAILDVLVYQRTVMPEYDEQIDRLDGEAQRYMRERDRWRFFDHEADKEFAAYWGPEHAAGDWESRRKAKRLLFDGDPAWRDVEFTHRETGKRIVPLCERPARPPQKPGVARTVPNPDGSTSTVYTLTQAQRDAIIHGGKPDVL